MLAQQVADGRDPPDVLGHVLAGHEHRLPARHRLAGRGQQFGEDALGPPGVEKGLDGRWVNHAARQRAGQLRQLGAVRRTGVPQARPPQLDRQHRAEVGHRGSSDQRMHEVIAGQARVVGPGEHHMGGQCGAGRLARAVRERDRVCLRLIRGRVGQQPPRRLVHGAVLDLTHDHRRDTRGDRVELVAAISGQTAAAGGVVQLLERHVRLASPGWRRIARGST